ncbi:MAG TPA: ornithine cyclodeaminase family protein [Caulobacteraceae bacterium]|nr:ornithine cyclodeaminase family protein [Caulobacteraceae bacterium]
MEVRVLSGADVAALLPMPACIDLMQQTMIAVSAGGARIPPRQVLPVSPGNLMGLMPGYLAEPECFGLKLISLFPNNPAAGLSSHLGLVMLFEAEHGQPVAILDAAELTAIRTAAVSGLATRLLAAPEAGDLAILGAGEQAHSHLAAMLAVRPVRRVRVWSRTPDHAVAFADAASQRHGLAIEVSASPRDAVLGADLVCTVTASPTPILEGAWIAPGAHLNLVGASRPNAAEVDTEMVARSRFFVDFRQSAALEAGEYLRAVEAGAITEAHILGEIGEVAAGQVGGRLGAEDVTVFKSLGIAAEDLAAAHYALAAARAQGVGQTFEL